MFWYVVDIRSAPGPSHYAGVLTSGFGRVRSGCETRVASRLGPDLLHWTVASRVGLTRRHEARRAVAPHISHHSLTPEINHPNVTLGCT